MSALREKNSRGKKWGSSDNYGKKHRIATCHVSPMRRRPRKPGPTASTWRRTWRQFREWCVYKSTWKVILYNWNCLPEFHRFSTLLETTTKTHEKFERQIIKQTTWCLHASKIFHPFFGNVMAAMLQYLLLMTTLASGLLFYCLFSFKI